MRKNNVTRASAIFRQQKRDAAMVRTKRRRQVDTDSYLLTDGMRVAIAS